MLIKAVTLGDKIELTKKTDIVETDTYYSMVYEIVDDTHMLIQAPLESGRIIPLEKEVIYYACIYTDRGLYRGEVEMIKRLKDNKLHYLELVFLTPMKKYQRRQFYRMNCILSFQYTFEEEADNVWMKGTLLDISGGGIRFSTDKLLDIDVNVKCNLELIVKDYVIELKTTGIVLQSKPIEPDRISFQNRIMFDSLNLEDREKIIKFIFEEERRRRKNTKGR